MMANDRLSDRAADRADAREARRPSCPPATRSCTSRSGTGFARSSFAAATTCSSRAAICSRSIAIFPSCTTSLLAGLPAGCVVDGEIVIATPRGLDFDALQLRLHPAASRVAKLAKETPAAFVAFDAARGRRTTICATRRRASGARGSSSCSPSVATADPPDADDARSRQVARSGCRASKAPGLDGVIAKPERRRLPARQARDDQGQARAHRRLRRRRLPLAQGREGRAASARCCSGCTTTQRRLHHVGVTSSFTMADAHGSSPRSSRRCASARSRSIRGASGPKPTAAR